jgi:hypothetical protein
LTYPYTYLDNKYITISHTDFFSKKAGNGKIYQRG